MAKSLEHLCGNPDQLRKFLSKLRFQNPDAAAKSILSLASDPLSFDPFSSVFGILTDCLAICPDPDLALNNLERFTAAVFSRSTLYGYFKSRPALLELIIKLFGSSHYLSDALVRNPEYLDWISDPDILESKKDRAVYLKELQQTLQLFPKRESKLHVLQRFKRRELLRIGVRDILGQTPLEITVGELSALTDALVQAAMDMAVDECLAKYGTPMDESTGKLIPAKFCVIGMGKLGGQELNYSSDIDLMFVYSGEGPVRGAKGKSSAFSTHEFFNRVGELIIHILAAPTREGYVFRVDLRLRPEGETGPLARSLESYETYYAIWGVAWEKLALIKARPIAGDEKLGQEFIAMTRPFVYQKHLSLTAIEDLRHLKKRIEGKLALKGNTFTEVKLGYGGIREIEFPIQLLQLMHGANAPALRGNNSLQTIKALGQAGLLLQDEERDLSEGYRFLRRVEHFLQIVHAFQIHELPTQDAELEKLAKRMGYVDKARESALATFRADHQRVTSLVHAFHARIFTDSPVDSGAQPGENLEFLFQKDQRVKALAHLSSLGFQKTDDALSALHLLANGPSYMHLSPATVREFVLLSPALLCLLKDSPNSDMALNQLERIVSVQGARSGFYKLLKENEKVLELLVTVAGNSPDLTEILVKEPAFLEALTRDPGLASPRGAEPMPAGQELQQYKDYEVLRIGVRDILHLASLPDTLGELSSLADVILTHGYTSLVGKRGPRFAVFALGKWGSREMGYYSDMDAVFVYDDDESKDQFYQKLAQSLIASVSLYKLDLRLRPGGKNDVLAMPLAGYRQYYASRVQTWEKQSLTRLRFIAGNQSVGDRLMRLTRDLLYSHGLSPAQIKEIQLMRDRMTKEKVSPVQKGRHVKLDVGGIVDIEFAAQLLQLHWGWKFPQLRQGSTLEILAKVGELELLDKKSLRTFTDGYLFLRNVENRIRMVSGQSSEIIPEGKEEQYQLVRRLGFHGKNSVDVLGGFWKKYKDSAVAVRQAFRKLCQIAAGQ